MKLQELFAETATAITYIPNAARVLGVHEAIFLQQLCYWTGKERGRYKGKDGWVFKSCKQLEDELGFTYKVHYRVRKSLADSGYIEQEYDHKKGTIWMKLIPEQLNKLEQKFRQCQIESNTKRSKNTAEF